MHNNVNQWLIMNYFTPLSEGCRLHLPEGKKQKQKNNYVKIATVLCNLIWCLLSKILLIYLLLLKKYLCMLKCCCLLCPNVNYMGAI